MSSPTFVRKGLLRLSWPLLAITVFTLLATLGNVALLSAASPELNAAVATANQILGVVYDVSVLFSIGALVVIAQQLGAGRLDAARRSVAIALRSSSALGIVLALAVALGAVVLVDLVGTPAEVADDAIVYLWIVAGGLAFNAYIVAASAVLRAYGRTPALLVIGIVVNVLDVALLAVLLLVLEWGAVGAALPTLVVRGVGVLVLAVLVRRATGASVLGRLPARADGEPGAAAMARLSIPSVLENGAYNLVIVAVVTLVNALGTDAINARSYVLTLTALVTGVVLALAQGNETIVGWDVGARDRATAKRRTLRTAGWTALVAALLTLVLALLAEPALAVFGAGDEVVTLARDGLFVSAILLPLSAVTAVVYGALRSAGDVVVPMVISIATSVLVLLPASWLLVGQWGLGVAGVFWALAVAEAVKAALLLVRLLRSRWSEGRPAEGAARAPGGRQRRITSSRVARVIAT
ncbi:hypothetical protein F8O01_03605 [Pseudoclavibacter chungangensis]|uniref:MATE family efflux transporter n=1 Tax=Pseudoclavibacter chungangensis TaxID=587635 RepID=A0A7J5C1R4_9MICO|nr:MATE family efflux transporter [Pseudoclavibacter chungangensis]KAB1660030.1 hypothetical protein F8O01_03605 [Pseudoclavibacter chungangensis]NYJ66879.1 Na+-driven multidrug efflux pump [Pseudoclavibacter chungangensis]